MKQIVLLLALVLAGFLSHAQSIRGTLMDPVEGVIVNGATVVLENEADSSVKASTISDKEGKFAFTNLSLGAYVLKATSIGFEQLENRVVLADSMPNLDLGDVYIPKKTTTLAGVVVVATAPPVTQKGDTTQFSASQYKVNPDATVEDLIKKKPGITVDKSGNVTAQGEQVKKVTVDGKDFFGDDATMAIRNLPSEVVDKIQVYDRLSDQAQLTGFDDGNTAKSINIVTKTGVKNGQFGRIFAGYGTNGKYSAGGNTSLFNGDRRISFVGNFNNINQQNFAQQDLLGVTSSGGGGGRGGRGGGGGFGGNTGNFTVGQSPGIAKTNALGVNYGDKWGKKINVTASYFFNNSYSTNQSSSTTETTLNSQTTQFSGSNSYNTSNNNNHRFNLRMEYQIDSNNAIYIIPSVSFQNNSSNYNGSSYAYNNDPQDSVNSAAGYNSGKRNGFNISNNIMFRHSFAKRGRTLMLGFQNSYNRNDGYSYNYNDLHFYTFDSLQNALQRRDSLLNQYIDNNTNGNQYSGRIAYTEPAGKQGMFEIQYNYQVQNNHADQKTYNYDEQNQDYTDYIQQLSNKFDNTITTNNAEVNYRLGRGRDNQFFVGVAYQNSRLESNRVAPYPTTVNQTFNSVLPNLRWMRKFGRYSNIRVFYRARNDFPSITQLQDVVNNSNPLNITAGNPNLKQSYTNTGSIRYSYTNTRTSHSFFANIFGQFANDYITNATYVPKRDSIIQNGIVVNAGSQYTVPVNLNGYKNINSFFTYSLPLKFIKSNLNLNASAVYQDLPGMINYVKTNTTSTTLGGGVVLGSNISEYVDFNLSYNANFYNSKSSIQTNVNNRYVNQTAGLFVNLLSKSGWFIQNNWSYQIYNGLIETGKTQSYLLWNAALGKKFLKRQAGELKLSVFDLLNQNQSLSRNVFANGFTNTQSLVLRQYFMLTFTYSLRNFGKGKPASSNNPEERRHNWRGGPPGGGMMPGGGGPPPGGGPMF